MKSKIHSSHIPYRKTRLWVVASDANFSGLRYVDVSKPLPETANRTKGYDVSLVAVLDEAKDALVYAHHPAHEK